MKVILAVLVILPLALAIHDKRSLLELLFQKDELKSLVSQLVTLAGSEETEHQCETQCHTLIQHNSLLEHGCPLVCRSLQSLAHHFGIPHPNKRMLLDSLFGGDELKNLVSQLVTLAGSDETEHQCEVQCHTLIKHNGILEHGCPLVCRSLQSLAHHFGIPHPNKRMLLDSFFGSAELTSLVSQLTTLAGSEETEHKCEMQCRTIVPHANILIHACPLVCRSLQSLAHRLGISQPMVMSTAMPLMSTTAMPLTSTPAMSHNKRFLETLFQGTEFTTLLTQMASTLGSDSTEAACESQCHALVKVDHILQYVCPLVCKSFQTLVHRFGIIVPTTSS